MSSFFQKQIGLFTFSSSRIESVSNEITIEGNYVQIA